MVTAESCMKQTRISLSIWFSLRQKWRAVQCTDYSHSDRCIGNISLPAASGAVVRAVPRSGSSWRCPAQLAPSSKCWFNLNMPSFCEDVNLQQKAQSLPLFQAVLISRFSDAPRTYLHSPPVGSWSSSLLHSPLGSHQWSCDANFSRLSLHKEGPVLSLRSRGSIGQSLMSLTEPQFC